MLEFFRNVAQTIPTSTSAASSDAPHPPTPAPTSSVEPPVPGSARDMLQDRAGIIVLREDLDFYAIPPKAEIEGPEMIEVKRAAGRALLRQDGIFSGLRRSEEAGTTEQHLIEMLTAGYASSSYLTLLLEWSADYNSLGSRLHRIACADRRIRHVYRGFNHDDIWGHRAGEPHKAVICSLALARLRTDVRGGPDAASNGGGGPAANAVGMAQKLLLFWRKPARRCWWEGVELDDVEGMEGTRLKVWIRRVWTLEMVRSPPFPSHLFASLSLYAV